jgi:hypothetical protein
MADGGWVNYLDARRLTASIFQFRYEPEAGLRRRGVAGWLIGLKT